LRFLLFAGWWILIFYLLWCLFNPYPTQVGQFGAFLGVAIQVLIGKWVGFLFLLYLFILSIKMYRRKITPRSASIFLGIFGLFFLFILFKGLIWEEGILGTEISQFFASFLGKPGTFILYLIMGGGVFYLFWEEFPHLFQIPKLPENPKNLLKNPLEELKKLLAHPFHTLTSLQQEIREKMEKLGEVTGKVTEKFKEVAPVFSCGVEETQGERKKREEDKKTSSQREIEELEEKREKKDKKGVEKEFLEEKVESRADISTQTEDKSEEIGEILHPLYPLELLSTPKKSNRETNGEIEKKEAILKGLFSRLEIPGKILYKGRGPIVSVFEVRLEKPISSKVFSQLEKELKEIFWERGVELLPLSRVRWEIEIPNRRREKVYFQTLLQKVEEELPVEKFGDFPLPLGIDRLGSPLLLPLKEINPLLIVGDTGSGKSMMVHSLLLTLLRYFPPSKLKLGIITSNNNEYYLYNRLPHLIENITPPTGGRALLEELLEMPPVTPVVLVVEEGEELVEELGGVQLLEEILTIPRIFPIFTLGRGGVTSSFAPLLPHFPTPIGLKLESKESEALFGTSAPSNLLDYGDAFLFQSNQFLLRFHTPYLRRWEVRKVIQHVSRKLP